MSKQLKTLWKDLRKSPGLLIALVVIVGFILYSIYKQNQTSTTTDTTTQPGQSPYQVLVFSPTPPASTTPTTDTGTGGTTTTTTSQSTLVTQTSGWLATTPGGTNNKGQNIANLPKGVTLSLVSGPVSFGANKYYKVSYQGKTGYVNSKTVGL